MNKSTITIIFCLLLSYEVNALNSSWNIGGWHKKTGWELDLDQRIMLGTKDFSRNILTFGVYQYFIAGNTSHEPDPNDSRTFKDEDSYYLLRSGVLFNLRRRNPKMISVAFRFGVGGGLGEFTNVSDRGGAYSTRVNGLDIVLSPALLGHFRCVEVEADFGSGVELLFSRQYLNTNLYDNGWPVIPWPRLEPALSVVYKMNDRLSAGLMIMPPYRVLFFKPVIGVRLVWNLKSKCDDMSGK